VKCSLGRGVVRHMGERAQALATGDLDHAAPSGSLHVWYELLNESNTRDDIHLVIPAPFVSGTIEPGGLRIHARIVDEDVDATERSLRFRCEPTDIPRNREISGDVHRTPSGASEFVGKISAALSIPPMNHDCDIFGCEAARDGGTDASGAPRHQCSPSRQPEILGARYRTTLILNASVPNCRHKDNHSGRYPSVARAVAMSPRSTMSVQPKACSNSRTFAFAPASLPLTNNV
jgi:hypothetical protein